MLSLSQQEQIVYHTEQIAKIYPEFYIIKVNQFDGIAKNTLDEWINFLKREEVKENTQAKGLKEAVDKLSILKLSEEERKDYDRFIANWRDNESVYVSQYKAGELDRQIDFAKKCLTKGMSITLIAELTEENIKNIQNSL